jgi:hypothetical protein
VDFIWFGGRECPLDLENVSIHLPESARGFAGRWGVALVGFCHTFLGRHLDTCQVSLVCSSMRSLCVCHLQGCVIVVYLRRRACLTHRAGADLVLYGFSIQFFVAAQRQCVRHSLETAIGKKMRPVLTLLFVQGCLGAFDTLWYHEFRLHLPGAPCSGLGRASPRRVAFELADVATGPSAH